MNNFKSSQEIHMTIVSHIKSPPFSQVDFTNLNYLTIKDTNWERLVESKSYYLFTEVIHTFFE